jgi:alkanesulfonate monooxygenase SsuD/methylene tetrahydromethanopterin reductase-like flavin-dependent oxidoreductase (luciferase family)
VLLGSGQLSAKLAAERGRAFAAAYHFGPLESEKAIRAYKENFQPSPHLAAPYALASVAVICAENNEIAEGLKLTGDLAMVHRMKGERGAPPTLEEARAYAFTPEELEKLANFAPVYGNPARVKAELSALAAKLNADEIIVVSNIADHAHRRRSYELVAEVFGPAESTVEQPAVLELPVIA